MKGKPPAEETFTKCVSDKRIHKELLQLNDEKAIQWAKDVTRHLTKDLQMASKPMKRSSVSLVTRETQMKTAVGQPDKPARVAVAWRCHVPPARTRPRPFARQRGRVSQNQTDAKDSKLCFLALVRGK